MSKKSGAGKFVLGAVVGATVGLLFAPKSGKENRKAIKEKADDLIADGKASMDGDAIVIDVTELGYDKVLAKGKISKTFKISAPKFSASAIEKIEEVGGEAIEL